MSEQTIVTQDISKLTKEGIKQLITICKLLLEIEKNAYTPAEVEKIKKSKKFQSLSKNFSDQEKQQFISIIERQTQPAKTTA